MSSLPIYCAAWGSQWGPLCSAVLSEMVGVWVPHAAHAFPPRVVLCPTRVPAAAFMNLRAGEVRGGKGEGVGS